MDKELQILEQIESNNEVSQRLLSEVLGISLGKVNNLLKKMKRNGYIKTFLQNQNKVVYSITPKGESERFKKMVEYVKENCGFTSDLKIMICELIKKLMSENELVYILLDENELKDIVKLVIIEMNDERLVAVRKNEISNLPDNSVVVVDIKYKYFSYNDIEIVGVIDNI
ncbi:MAG: winged helix-turn-helix transcriptional regulator [Firmicutes bacterium]|nr:winged helix-turn-helix transcriptional regulator [Bacillota bacterium]